jgi:UDP-N-acetylglucosamine transferase subunit ALG13
MWLQPESAAVVLHDLFRRAVLMKLLQVEGVVEESQLEVGDQVVEVGQVVVVEVDQMRLAVEVVAYLMEEVVVQWMEEQYVQVAASVADFDSQLMLEEVASHPSVGVVEVVQLPEYDQQNETVMQQCVLVEEEEGLKYEYLHKDVHIILRL